MTLKEFYEKWKEFTSRDLRPKEECDAFWEVINKNPISVMIKYQVLEGCFDDIFYEEESGMYRYNSLEVSSIIDTLLVKMYTDLEFDMENILIEYDLICDMDLVEEIRSRNADADRFYLTLGDQFEQELELRNSTAAVLGKSIKSLQEFIEGFVEKIESYNIDASTLQEVTDTLKNINNTVEEVKSITG